MQYVNRQIPLSPEEKQKREEERLQKEKDLKLRNNRLGVTVFQVSWIMAFVVLVIAYWQLGFSEGWQPSPELAPNPVLPSLATLGLIVSGMLARQSLKIVEQTEPKSKPSHAPAFRKTWLASIALGVFFLLVMLQQFYALPFDTDVERFGMIYRLMIAYHGLHALVSLVFMLQVWRFGADHRYHSANVWAVEGSAKLWYFVIVAWLLFYAVLYLPFLL